VNRALDSMHIIHDMAVQSKCFDMHGGVVLHPPEDDWSEHDGDDFTWACDTPWLEFAGSGGPVVIVGEGPVKAIIQRRTALYYMVLRPFTWTEYGQPCTDYEVAAVERYPARALGVVAQMLVEDVCSRYMPMHGE
jgi:hypothetical protein